MITALPATTSATLAPILARHGVARAWVYGSVARGEARPDSDLDLIVSWHNPAVSLLDLVALKLDLEDALHRPVDVSGLEDLSRRVRPYVEREMVLVYGITLVNHKRGWSTWWMPARPFRASRMA